MATDEKFTAQFVEKTKGIRRSSRVTAIVRTRPESERDETVAVAAYRLSAERMATSRTQLLRSLTYRYGTGQTFCENLRETRTRAQANVVSAAPEAASLWLADAVAVSGTRDEVEELAGHEDVVSVGWNDTYRAPEVLQTPLEDTPEAVDGSAWGLARIRAPQVWGITRGEGVLVGHLDTGVDDSHPALAGKVDAFEEFDALGNPLGSAPHDTQGHGTHTAGTIVARTHEGLNLGVAPRARLASALVLPGGGGTFAQIAAGMQWAVDQGAHVINMSLGGSGYDPAWELPVLNASMSGVLVVASIGNSGLGTSGGPGNVLFSLSVGATQDEEQIAGFSGGEAQVNILLLGFLPVSYTTPIISAPGVQVVSTVPGDGLAALNGTSMAAPHVAGAAALVMAAEPALQGDPFAVRDLLAATTEDFGEGGADIRYGFGRLDAAAAVQGALSVG